MPDNPEHKPIHECGVLDVLTDYDWREVFKYADGEWIENGPSDASRANSPFNREDVEEIIASEVGENDGSSWIMLGKLKSGLFFFIEASCDYTGWGCQESGRSYVSDTKEKLIRFGMSDGDRIRLKCEIV